MPDELSDIIADLMMGGYGEEEEEEEEEELDVEGVEVQDIDNKSPQSREVELEISAATDSHHHRISSSLKRKSAEESVESVVTDDDSDNVQQPQSQHPKKPKSDSTQQELSNDQKIGAFNALLSEKNVDPFGTWEAQMEKINDDPRFNCKAYNPLSIFFFVSNFIPFFF